MLKRFLLLGVAIAFISRIAAQTDVDALRYSTTLLQGTARNAGVGNVMGTISADLSVLSSNPAGIARFSSSEITLTPAIGIYRSSSSFLGTTSDDSKVKFQLTNVGAVVVSKYGKSGNSDSKWSKLNFGFALNRLADYNDQFFFSGYNDRNSLLNAYYEKLADRDVIQSEQDAKTKYPFDASIAYKLGLISSDTLGNLFTATNNGNMQQEFNIRRSGGMDEFSIGIASSYDNKIMVGAAIGVPFLNYTDRLYLKETDTRDSAFDLNYFSYESFIRTRGIGFNLKAGIIAMPVSNLRLSLAIQTPGIIFMNDAFVSQMEVDYASESVIYVGESPEGISKYKFRQPWKVTTGAGYIHKYGFLAAEYELSSAGSSRMRFNQDDAGTKAYEDLVNDAIRSKYGLFHTIRFGVEFKYDPIRIRGGIQYRTSPFKNDFAPDGISTNSLTYSAGFGYRGKKFFADIAYVQTNVKELYLPYQLSTPEWNPVPEAVLKSKRPSVLLTLGYKL